MVPDAVTVPVHCECGWHGFRLPAKVQARPCPNCDGEVWRWHALESAERTRRKLMGNVDLPPMPAGDIAETYGKRRAAPHQYDIEDEIAARNAPVPRLPNPYYMQVVTGGVQIFRIPAHCLRRGPVRRRR